MKARILACVLLLLLPITVCGQENKVEGTNQAYLWLSDLTVKLTKGEVARIEILQIPRQVLTRTRITPDMLEKQYHYKLTIRDVRGEEQQKRMIEAMQSIAIRPHPEMPDIRWGVIFYDLDDRRLNAIYLDKTGGRGAIGNQPVSMKGDFLEWLDGKFSGCFH